MPTTSKHDDWREKAGVVMSLLEDLRREALKNGFPEGSSWDVIKQAIRHKHFVTDWNTGIQRILGAALGTPLTVDDLFRELTKSKSIRKIEALTLHRLRTRLWQGVKAKKWVQLDGPQPRYTLAPPTAPAATPDPLATRMRAAGRPKP